MYIICAILCLFSVLGSRVGALQISIVIIIIKKKKKRNLSEFTHCASSVNLSNLPAVWFLLHVYSDTILLHVYSDTINSLV